LLSINSTFYFGLGIKAKILASIWRLKSRPENRGLGVVVSLSLDVLATALVFNPEAEVKAKRLTLCQDEANVLARR